MTQTLERSTEQVKIGKASARYSATSTLSDNSGWSVRGGRYLKPLDLSKAQAIGFWLYGDGKGEAFKLQLHDKAGGWCDMVTHVILPAGVISNSISPDPAIWTVRMSTNLLIYYNGIPSKQTVTCYVDEIRAVPAIAGLRNPTLTIGGKRLVFPAELSTGDRLVFDGSKCRLHRGAKAELEWIQPQGGPVTLEPGRQSRRVVLRRGPAAAVPRGRVAGQALRPRL